MVTQVSIHEDPTDGSMGVQERTTFGKTFASSEDYVQPGAVTARDQYGDRITTTDPNALPDDAIVTVQGMQITAAQAREFGLLEGVFEEARANAVQTEERQEQAQSAFEAGEGAFYDVESAEIAMQAALEAGTATGEEANTIVTAMAEAQMMGFDADAVESIFWAVHEGDQATLEALPAEVQEAAQRHHDNVMAALEASAYAEIGAEAVEMLREACEADPAVDAAVSEYQMMRLTGQTKGLTWSDLANDIMDHLGWD